MIRAYRVVKKEELPTITINKINFEGGFIMVLSDKEPIGIIVYDSDKERYLMLDSFCGSFMSGVDPVYSTDELEELLKVIEKDYCGLIEYNFIPVVE